MDIYSTSPHPATRSGRWAGGRDLPEFPLCSRRIHFSRRHAPGVRRQARTGAHRHRPGALQTWRSANLAREAGKHEEALRLYADVYARVPQFHHALRRQAGEEIILGRGGHRAGEIAGLAYGPTRDLPADLHYIGPIIWEPDVPAPPWLDMLDPNRPTIYFTMGSTGFPRFFEQAVEIFGGF